MCRQEIAMLARRNNLSEQQRTIEDLAQESQLSIDAVTQLYEDERTLLQADARLTNFLPILTLRHVREALRRRSAEERAPAP